MAMIVDRTDPYAALGLTPQATQEQIRRAYLALLRQNHPDTRRPGNRADNEASNTALQHVIGAYAILGDPARRASYDHRTSTHRTSTRARGRPTMPAPSNVPDQPPIQAGPVRWHGSRR